MAEDHNTRNEDIRYAVLAHLYDRQGASQTPDTIHRYLSREFSRLGKSEVANACAFLAEMDLLTIEEERLGSTLYYRISAQGILTHERR